MRTIYVSPEFPLNRRMRKAVQRGKLQVVRMRGERLSLGGGMAGEGARPFRTFSSPLVCMADGGAEAGGGPGGSDDGREWLDAFCGELSHLADPDKVKAVKRVVERTIGRDAIIALARNLKESVGEIEKSGDSDEDGAGFDIVRKSAREIFRGPVQFRVSIFQREYVWGDEQWEDFWADASGSKPQYDGGIVLRDIGQNRYEVIDGQQRLTTVCLLVIAALRMLHDPEENGGFGVPRNHSVCKELADAFLVHGGDLDGDIVRRNMKMVPHDLQWNGDGIFLSRLMSIRARQPGGEFDPFHELGNTPQIQMKKSVKDFFMKNLRGLGLQTPEEVRDFVLDQMGSNLVFSRVVAARNEAAHAIFETLNGRGRALIPAELIKAYFMSFLDDTDAGRFRREWDRIRNQLNGAGLRGAGNRDRGNMELAGFIWAVYVCKFRPISKRHLFREITRKIREKSDAREFFKAMQEQIESYVQILGPDPIFWGQEFDKVDSLRHLRTSRARAPFIMAARSYEQSNRGAFSESLGICSAVGLRLNVCGHPRGIDHNLPGNVFNRLARRIWRAEELSVDDVLADPDLGSLYHKKAAFEKDFGEFELRAGDGDLSDNQIEFFAYMLRMLEAHLGGDVDRLKGREPRDYVVPCHTIGAAMHRLCDYCLQGERGEPEFLTSQGTVGMGRDQRGEQLGKWAAEVADWRINRFEDE